MVKDTNLTKDYYKSGEAEKVSTHKQKNRGDLDRQISVVSQFAVKQNLKNMEIIPDIGSGLDNNRKGLAKLILMIQEDKISRVFTKDRLARSGSNYLGMICGFHKTGIIAASSGTEDKPTPEGLAEDIISIIHSFPGKLYGLRKKLEDDICTGLERDTGKRWQLW